MARLWEVAPPSLLRGPVSAAAMSPDGTRVAVLQAGALRLWTRATGEVRTLARIRGKPRSVAFSRGDVVAAGSSGGRRGGPYGVTVDLEAREVHEFSRRSVFEVAFNDAGDRLVTYTYSGLALRDPRAPAKRDYVETSWGGRLSATFSRDGRILLTEPWSTPRVVDPRTSKEKELKGRDEQTELERTETTGDFSPDGRWVVTPEQRQAIVWDSRSGHEMTRLSGHTGRVKAAAVSNDGRRIATGSADRSVRVWDVRTGRSVAVLQAHAGAVTDVAFTPSGDEILSRGRDGVVRFSPCYGCRSTAALVAEARRRITRGFTREERRAFLG
jgi:WD40 repeat protein